MRLRCTLRAADRHAGKRQPAPGSAAERRIARHRLAEIIDRPQAGKGIEAESADGP